MTDSRRKKLDNMPISVVIREIIEEIESIISRAEEWASSYPNSNKHWDIQIDYLHAAKLALYNSLKVVAKK